MMRMRRMAATRSAVLVRDSSARSAAKASAVNSPPAVRAHRGCAFEGSYNDRTTAVARCDHSKRIDDAEQLHRFKVDSTSCGHPIGSTLLHDRVKARRGTRQR